MEISFQVWNVLEYPGCRKFICWLFQVAVGLDPLYHHFIGFCPEMGLVVPGKAPSADYSARHFAQGLLVQVFCLMQILTQQQCVRCRDWQLYGHRDATWAGWWYCEGCWLQSCGWQRLCTLGSHPERTADRANLDSSDRGPRFARGPVDPRPRKSRFLRPQTALVAGSRRPRTAQIWECVFAGH